MYTKLQIGSPVISAEVPGREGKVLGLNKAGFYTVRWHNAVDAEGMRCVESGEVRQYRRDAIVAVNSRGKLANVETVTNVPTDENLLDNVLPFKPEPHADSPVLSEGKES